MAFDPDAYLAAPPAKAAFDPDAYLAGKPTAAPAAKPSFSDMLSAAYRTGGYAGVTDPGYRTVMGTGLTDPVVAVRELTGTISPEAVRQREAEYQAVAAKTPGAGFGRFMGSAITTLPLAVVPGAPAGANMLLRTGIGAGTGAGAAMLTQPTSGEGDFLTNKLKQGAMGALVGGAAPIVGEGIGAGVNFARQKFANTGAQTTEALKAAETAAWNAVKNSKATYDATPFRNSVQDLLSPKEFNYDPDTFPALTKAVSRIDNLAEDVAAGKPNSIHELRTVRTMLQNVEGSNVTKSEKALAGAIKGQLDSFMANQGGEDAAAWAKARDISNTLFRSGDVKNILSASEAASGATSKEIRERFTDLLNSKSIKSYTDEQQALIKQIADGTLPEKGLELIGRMAPKSLTWGKIATLIGIGGAGHNYVDPRVAGAAAAAFGGGAMARGAANAMARQRVNMLDELIRGGKLPTTVTGPTAMEMPYAINALTPNVSQNSMAGR